MIPPQTPPSSAARIPTQIGLGLRGPHIRHVLETQPDVDWFEIHPENVMRDHGACLQMVAIRADYPLSLHAVGLSLGSASGVDAAHLAALARVVDVLDPGLVSDHLSWSAAGGVFLPELMTLPYTTEALDVCAHNIDAVQTVLRRKILIENPSHYLGFDQATMDEPEFLAALARRTGCGVLLDINNIVVSAYNLGRDPAAMVRAYLNAIPSDVVGELHVAGHTCTTLDDGSPIRIDTHSAAPSDEVMTLCATAIAHLGPKPILIEWDQDLPPFEDLLSEAARAKTVLERSDVDA